MRRRALCCLVAGFAALAGCSRQQATTCDTDARYATARSAPPVQIPDDLSPPNESDALRLPPAVGASNTTTARPCLQSPPSFFGDSSPFQRDPEAEESAPAPAGSEPASPPGDRVIEN
jgi:hypothetical protein